MGCASSKPSSKSKKSKDSADVDKENNHKKQKNQNGKSSIPKSESGSKSGHLDGSLDAPIRLDKQLADELGHQQSRVVDFLVRAVSKEFALDLVKNSKQTGVKSDEAAGRVVQENYDLTTDVASKAIALLKTTQSPDSNITTYRQLNDRLKSSQYLCKTQTHKNRLCDLTVNKIKESVDLINQEGSSTSGLLDFLAKYDQDQQLTPPQTPTATTVTSSSPSDENAVLLSRAQANELARILFLSNRARPVVHASPKVKDAYYVNKQLTDNTEITVSKKEIDDILHKFDEPFTFQIKNLTYYDSPMITASPTRDSQPSASVNLLHELTQEQSLSSPHSDTSFTQVTAEVVDNVNHNDTTIEYEITTGENNNNNNSNNQANNHVDDNKNIKVEGDGEDDADLALATVAVMSALASSAAADENNNNNHQSANNELFSDEDFAKTTIVNTTITTTTRTTTITSSDNNEPDQVVTRQETKEIVEVHHDDQDHKSDHDYEDETQQEQQQQEAEEDVLDPILKQSLLDDRFYNNHSFKTEPPVNGQGLNDAATEIQAAQRAHAARQVADSLIDQIAEKAATTIQATYRGYKTRKEIRPVLAGKRAKSIEYHESVSIVEVVSTPTPTSTSIVDESNNNQIESQQSEVSDTTTSTVTTTTTTTITTTTTSLTDHTPETTTTITTNPDGTNSEPVEESNKAATKIQATYRGFRTRKHLKELNK